MIQNCEVSHRLEATRGETEEYKEKIKIDKGQAGVLVTAATIYIVHCSLSHTFLDEESHVQHRDVPEEHIEHCAQNCLSAYHTACGNTTYW